MGGYLGRVDVSGFGYGLAFVAALATGVDATGQTGQPAVPKRPTSAAPAVPKPATAVPPAPAAVVPSADYRIGSDDVLTITFWRQQDLSGDVVVRPDGKISLPLLNDVQAAGLTPTELRNVLISEAQRFVEDPNATVVVKQINSRRVFITGAISKPGPYTLTVPTSVLQLIAMAGGVLEYADKKNIVIIRTEKGGMTMRFNYKDVVNRKNLSQNIELKPGDTVIVP